MQSKWNEINLREYKDTPDVILWNCLSIDDMSDNFIREFKDYIRWNSKNVALLFERDEKFIKEMLMWLDWRNIFDEWYRN